MASLHFNYLFIVVCLVAVHLAKSAGADCDKSKCQGPLRHYEAMGCKPVYRNPDDCCAYKYNCDHIADRKADKCYVAGHEYSVNENLREEDSNPCDKGCYCHDSGVPNRGATFNCAIVDCFTRPPPPGCYLQRNGTSCCSSHTPVCPKTPEERPTCRVEGKTLLDGEYFAVGNQRCYCGPGFVEGQYDAPFCYTQRQDSCGLELRHGDDIRNNCPPVFYDSQSPQKDCGIAFRCLNSRDEIIKHEGEKSGNEDLKCTFGNMILGLGDSLKPSTDYDSVCVSCLCEVPPVLTCKRLPDDKCDSTKHEDFSKYHSVA